jgi:hypothetical protein
MRRQLIVVGALVFLFVPEAVSRGYVCKLDRETRRIQLVEDERGVACELIYWPRPDAGTRLWYARHDRDFCAKKAQELVSELMDAAWQCSMPTEVPLPRTTTKRVM